MEEACGGAVARALAARARWMPFLGRHAWRGGTGGPRAAGAPMRAWGLGLAEEKGVGPSLQDGGGAAARRRGG